MKIQSISDLHLEFDPYFLPENNGSDILLLNGDICVAKRLGVSIDSPYHFVSEKSEVFFKHCSEHWDHVFYIPGNHEYYHGNINKTPDILLNYLEKYPNIHFLDNGCYILNNTLIIGSTLWTDCNKRNPLVMNVIRQSLNDFVLITIDDKGVYHKFNTTNMVQIHSLGLTYIQNTINTYGNDVDNIIVMSHHAPSELSINEKYKTDRDYYLNFGFFSDLSTFILDNPKITLWAHGHMHDNCDYMLGSTRIICNPKGYNDQNKLFDANKIIQI